VERPHINRSASTVPPRNPPHNLGSALLGIGDFKFIIVELYFVGFQRQWRRTSKVFAVKPEDTFAADADQLPVSLVLSKTD